MRKKHERTQSKHLVEITRYTNIHSIDSFTLLPASHYALLEGQKDFVLLETSRFDGGNRRSFFFLHPTRIISIHRFEDVPQLFVEIEKSITEGFFVAGYFGYECGYHFENIDPHAPLHRSVPLAWFGVYRTPLIFNHEAGMFEGEQPVIPAAREERFSLKRCSLKISEP